MLGAGQLRRRGGRAGGGRSTWGGLEAARIRRPAFAAGHRQHFARGAASRWTPCCAVGRVDAVGNTTTGFSPCEAVIHRNWGIFVSKQADLKSPALHQPIADEQNMLTGINLSRLYTYQLVYPDPPGGWQWLYLTGGVCSDVGELGRERHCRCAGTPTCYATLLNNSEGSASGPSSGFDVGGNSSAAVQYGAEFGRWSGQAAWCSTLVAGDNHFDTRWVSPVGTKTSPGTALLNAILMNVNTTVAQKTLAKAALAMFGSISGTIDSVSHRHTTREERRNCQSDSAVSGVLRPIGVLEPFEGFSQPAAGDRDEAQPLSTVSELILDTTGAAAGSTHHQSVFSSRRLRIT